MPMWGGFTGLNAGYVVELYERYRRDPNTVDAATRAIFEHWTPPMAALEPVAAPADALKIVGAVNLAESIRKFGHLDAKIDPLGGARPGDPSLRLETYGLTEEDLRRLPAGLITGSIAEGKENALDVIEALRRVYCLTTGYDYAHLRSPEEREWLREAAETFRFRPPNDPHDAPALLGRLTQVEVFERFLHRTFPGKTRFSIEGVDMLVPVLDEAVSEAAETGMQRILIGMAHRARLNVLAHILNKPYARILAEFKDPVRARNFREDQGWTGDVKYHLGASRAVQNGLPVELVISLPPNPSHLEAVNPVVEGMARAAGTSVQARGAARFDPLLTLPILIHGDAAFVGEGVVAETLNFHRLPGYQTGGTIHIIANNQLGFTATPEDSRSMIYSSDLARGFRIPIVHVSADDPEACIESARLAIAYRNRFHKDFLIDLIGYRRHGHNEGDEPSYTQPLMYQKIAAHPTVREIWAKVLLDRSVIAVSCPDELVRKNQEELEKALASLEPETALAETPPEPPPRGAARQARTAVPEARLREFHASLLALPEGFNVNPKLTRARARRAKALDDPEAKTIDWAMAEELALASILAEGIAVRLTGQDTERGTFSQRHAVFHDVKTGQRYIPLQALPQARAAFEVRNTALTEAAVLGFEYGYSLQAPERLVIWEAQYGDFINNAQTIIDEFLLSARAKWGQTPSLVMLLPHSYEGQGPDHSSARPERFLQLAAEMNFRMANCTTAAQYFHLLRLQASLLQVDPLPLVVLAPKSLLRHPRTVSSLRELSEGAWQRVLDDPEADGRRAEVMRLVLCSGKIFVDLDTSEFRAEAGWVGLVRLEQLYPFPEGDLQRVLESYRNLEEIVWVQEEPENMGAWEFVRPQLVRLAGEHWPRSDRSAHLRYVGRARSSSPAEGSLARHALNQQAIIRQAFSKELEAAGEDMVAVKKTEIRIAEKD